MNIQVSDFIKDNFFYISSDNIEKITPRLYGFALCDDTLYINTRKNIMCAPLATGIYVNIYVSKNSVVIQQDYNGSSGIFYYKEDNFFALSNSLFFLASCLKKRMTLNKDYAKYFIAENLAFTLFDKTPIKEITLLPRDVYVVIDKHSRSCEIKNTERIRREIKINTSHGIQLLDEWHAHYRHFVSGLAKITQNISIALSGGYDSRASFSLFASDTDILNRCRIYSIPDQTADFEIASAISKSLNFTLNKALPQEFLKTPLEDQIAANIFVTMGFHQHLYPITYLKNKLYKVTGSAGEIHRTHWKMTQEAFVRQRLVNKAFLPSAWHEEISALINSQIDEVRKYFDIDTSCNNELIDRVYREGRARGHFGKGCMINFLFGQVCINPLMDYRLDKINPYIEENDDKSLLMAVIYDRFMRKSCHIGFAGNRKISPETFKIAKKINDTYPVSCDHEKNSSLRIIDETQIFPEYSEKSSSGDLCSFFVNLLYDHKIVDSIKEIYGDEFYDIAVKEQNKFLTAKNRHLRYRFVYSIVSFALMRSVLSLEL